MNRSFIDVYYILGWINVLPCWILLHLFKYFLLRLPAVRYCLLRVHCNQ